MAKLTSLLLAAVLAGAVPAGAAIAQAQEGTESQNQSRSGQPLPKEALGHWSFTAYTGDYCSFTGAMRLSVPHPSSEEDTDFHCELVARHTCPAPGRDTAPDDAPEPEFDSVVGFDYVVRQSCTARLSGRQIIVRSTIEEFLKGDPSPTYWPDNFLVTLQSENRMTGSLISHGTHPAVFTRSTDGIG